MDSNRRCNCWRVNLRFSSCCHEYKALSMPECKHPTCGPTCRRPKKQRKVYTIKRTALQRTAAKIKPVSKKRRGQFAEYGPKREQFLKEHPLCEIRSPEPGVCTHFATVIHHSNGKENERLNIVEDWFSSCAGCNVWIEGPGTKWAYETGIKQHKHHSNNLINGLPNSL